MPYRSSRFLLLVVPALVGLGVAAPAGASGTSASATTLAKAAVAATRSATSLTFQGTGVSDNQPVAIDVTVSASKAFGTLTYNGQSTTLRRIGTTIYAQGTKGFLQQQGLSAAQATAEANKWFKIPKSSDPTDFKSIDQFLTIPGVLSGLLPSKGTTAVTGVTTSTLQGQPVKVLTGTLAGQKGTFYVATRGKAFILRIIQSGASGSGGTVNITNFDRPVHVSAPSAVENG